MHKKKKIYDNASSFRSMTQGMWSCWSVCLSSALVQTAGWTVLKFGPGIHGSQRMNPTDFDDPLTQPKVEQSLAVLLA